MVALHTCWVLALLVFGWGNPVHRGWLALYTILQVFCAWILGTLGRRWTTRIIVIDELLVVHGPFHFIRTPIIRLS